MPNVVATHQEKRLVSNIDFKSGVKREDYTLPVQKQEHQKVVVNPKNPHITTYLNLNRPGSDYSWQRPKRKHTSVNIGSTFAMFDGN